MGLACGKKAFVETASIIRSNSVRLRQSRPPARKGGAFGDQKGLATGRDQGIIVFVRIRPTSVREEGKSGCLAIVSPQQLRVPASRLNPVERTCSFDAVLPEATTQEEVYQVAGPKLLHNALQGYNATMLAYGQTGSGKTFTMEGVSHDPGIIPRLCGGLFAAIRAHDADMRASVVASYVEIYQESIRDLLESSKVLPGRRISPQGGRAYASVSPAGRYDGRVTTSSAKGRLVIRENKAVLAVRESRHDLLGHGVTALARVYVSQGGVYIENVTTHDVGDETAVLQLLERGSSFRTKGETQMNAVSSRSHAVLTLAVTQMPRDREGIGGESGGDRAAGCIDSTPAPAVHSKISLVDLAGSERAKSTEASGQRLKEGAQINKSLSALGNVIKALTTGGNAHVPYRDSKLTRLLQDSLGGTAYTVVCCNVSPVDDSVNETLSTLRFAERLKKVKNKMVVNMDPRTEELLALKRENAELRAEIARLESILADQRDEEGQPPRGEGKQSSHASERLRGGSRSSSNFEEPLTPPR